MPHVISQAKKIKLIEKNKTLKTLPNLFISVKKSLKDSNKFQKNSKTIEGQYLLSRIQKYLLVIRPFHFY